MLDLVVLVRKLTQGQPVAEMVVASAGGAASTPPATAAGAGSAAQAAAGMPAPQAAGGASASVDPYQVAERVYELLRRDLVTEQARRGGRL
jgi:hypothetical protein